MVTASKFAASAASRYAIICHDKGVIQKTGESVAVNDQYRVHFKPGLKLRERVNAAFFGGTSAA